LLKKIYVIVVLTVLLTSSYVAVSLDPTSSSATSVAYSPQMRKSSYGIEPKPTVAYPQINMSEQQASPSNTSLLEKTIYFDVTDYLTPKEIAFDLPFDDKFLAIDGASQSGVLRINYTITYPNGTLATKNPITTTVTSPMHFETINPPAGTWRIVVTLIDTGETTGWIQAVSYQHGIKLVMSLEKAKLNLISGRAIYFKIPLFAAMDWFYLHVEKVALGDILIRLRQQGSYQTDYYSNWNYVSDFFPSKSHSNGTYLLSITNYDRVDIFVQITKPPGIKLKLNVDAGRAVRSLYVVDQEFFNISINLSYDWILLDGAVIESGSAIFLLIDTNLDIIVQDTSSNPSDFIREQWISKPEIGNYILAIFSYQYAIVTAKVTSASSLEVNSGTGLDCNYSFAQSGQTFYLNISLFKSYILFASTTSSSGNAKFALFDSGFGTTWTWGPSTGLFFPGPIKPIKPFYILKVQGQTNSSSLVHLRFGGFEDYSIETPDASNYWSRFQGDMVVSNITVRTISDYLFQHAGAVSDNILVALYDNNFNEKWRRGKCGYTRSI